MSSASSGIMRAQLAPWIASGQVKIMMQVGLNMDPAFPEAPLVTGFANRREDHEILQLMFAQQLMACPLLMPPDVPAERVDAFRKAFDATMRDPGFLADAARQNLKVDPFSGSAIEELLVDLYATPPAVLARFAGLLAN